MVSVPGRRRAAVALKKKGRNSRLLSGTDRQPEDGGDGRSQTANADQMSQPGPGGEQHSQQHRQKEKCRPKVGLFENQGERNEGDREWNREAREATVVFTVHEIPCE